MTIVLQSCFTMLLLALSMKSCAAWFPFLSEWSCKLILIPQSGWDQFRGGGHYATGVCLRGWDQFSGGGHYVTGVRFLCCGLPVFGKGGAFCMGVHFLRGRSKPQHIIYFTEDSGVGGAGDSNFSNVRTYVSTLKESLPSTEYTCLINEHSRRTVATDPGSQ